MSSPAIRCRVVHGLSPPEGYVFSAIVCIHLSINALVVVESLASCLRSVTGGVEVIIMVPSVESSSRPENVSSVLIYIVTIVYYGEVH